MWKSILGWFTILFCHLAFVGDEPLCDTEVGFFLPTNQQQTNKGVDKVRLMAPVLASSTWRTWPERASVQKNRQIWELNWTQASDWTNFYINEHIRDLWETRGERSSLTGHLLSVLAKYSESRPLLLYAVFLKICLRLWSQPPSGCQSEKKCFSSGKKTRCCGDFCQFSGLLTKHQSITLYVSPFQSLSMKRNHFPIRVPVILFMCSANQSSLVSLLPWTATFRPWSSHPRRYRQANHNTRDKG